MLNETTTKKVEAARQRYQELSAQVEWPNERAIYLARLREGMGRANGAGSTAQERGSALRGRLWEEAGVIKLANEIAAERGTPTMAPQFQRAHYLSGHDDIAQLVYAIISDRPASGVDAALADARHYWRRKD